MRADFQCVLRDVMIEVGELRDKRVLIIEYRKILVLWCYIRFFSLEKILK